MHYNPKTGHRKTEEEAKETDEKGGGETVLVLGVTKLFCFFATAETPIYCSLPLRQRDKNMCTHYLF